MLHTPTTRCSHGGTPPPPSPPTSFLPTAPILIFFLPCPTSFCPSVDWVQDTGTATSKWGDLGYWDVSGVGDFSYAFSKIRDQAGGSKVKNGNPKAATFVGTGMSKWITTSLTTLKETFEGAASMNSDLSGWNVAKVTILNYVFSKAGKFNGDISGWDTGTVTDIDNCFQNSGLNQDVSKWNIGNVNKFNGFNSLGDMDSCNKRKLALAW